MNTVMGSIFSDVKISMSVLPNSSFLIAKECGFVINYGSYLFGDDNIPFIIKKIHNTGNGRMVI
jgi:hypothetical protein